MTDLTKITTPFGLLDAETKRAFESHPGVIEEWSGDGWTKKRDSTFHRAVTYRARPEPPKPREFWVTIYPNPPHLCYTSRDAAVDPKMSYEMVHVREVLP